MWEGHKVWELAPRCVNGEKKRHFKSTLKNFGNPSKSSAEKARAGGRRRDGCVCKNFGKFFKINLTIVLKPESLTSIEIYFSMKA